MAANRDERFDRPWDAPAAHWPDRPGVVAGRDRSAGGTWMAARGGLVAAVLNRPGSLGPAPGKLSRGGLPLMALEHGSAAAAAQPVRGLDAGAYRGFNLLVVDAGSAQFVRGTGQGRAEGWALAPGLHVVTAHDPNDPSCPRTRAQLPRFAAAAVPDPGRGDWTEWAALLADASGPRGSALNVPPLDGFGTICSSLLAVPAEGAADWLFAAGPPDRAPFARVAPPG